MSKKLLTLATLLLAVGAIVTSCTKDVAEPQVDGAQVPETRAFGDKSPKVMVYYEINDTNPLNALSYKMGGAQFIDIVQLFASNIQKDASGYPTIFFNDKLAPVMAAGSTYIQPIRQAGTKVLLNVLGDHKGIGVSNLTVDQADRFADILTYCVDFYNLDGIGFDDEYADYSTALIPGSYGNLIKALRAKLDAKFPGERKIIEVFQWGNTGSSQIDAAAGAMIDFADHGSFSPTGFSTGSSIQGMTNDRWMPMAINMGSNWAAYKTLIKNNAVKAKNYGGIMMFNVRKASEVNPLTVFNAIAEGAYASTVTYTGTEYSRDWTPQPAGFTITKDNVPAYAPKFAGN